MRKPINFISRSINIGNSIGITIPKNIKNLLGIKKGDYLQISVEKIEKNPNNIVDYNKTP